MLWDTHTVIGRLPTLTDGDFSEPPIVSEYGMQLSNFMAVTNGNGVAGSITIENPNRPKNTSIYYPYGPIEMLASSYQESATQSTDAVTPDAVARLQKSLKEQATANQAGRWPTPLVVRVPDNATLDPNCNLGFQQLIPGVWIPLRASGTCRVVTQWQKLDSVTVAATPQGEQVSVVMSPAPGHGLDFEADGSDAEGSEGTI